MQGAFSFSLVVRPCLQHVVSVGERRGVQGACDLFWLSWTARACRFAHAYVIVFPVWRLATRIPTRKMMSNPEVRGH